MQTSELLEEVRKYVEDNIGDFHAKRIHRLDTLKLYDILKTKNPYLFKAKYILTASELIKGIVDNYISSSEEAQFGDWLEKLAIFINNKVYGGQKSAIAGMDLEFTKDRIRYVVTIKSGPNWGNSRQVKKMEDDFRTIKRTIRTSGSTEQIIAINGCCYGQDNVPDKGVYFKYCGQLFWEFISGITELYTEIIEPLGAKARERNDDFNTVYSAKINEFTLKFITDFCSTDNLIDWKKLVKFNSGKKVQSNET